MGKEKSSYAHVPDTITDEIKLAPKPVLCREGRGVRHFSCLYYDYCLDKAAKAMWTGFTCAECIFYEKRDSDQPN